MSIFNASRSITLERDKVAGIATVKLVYVAPVFKVNGLLYVVNCLFGNALTAVESVGAEADDP